MTKRNSPRSKQTRKARSFPNAVPVLGPGKGPYEMRVLTTNLVFRILPADTAKDRELLQQLAGACRKAADLFKRYRESLSSRAHNLDPLSLEQSWVVPTNAEDGSPPTMITELSEIGHVSPAELFGSMVMARLPGGYDPRDLQRFGFERLMEEMSRWCQRFARPGKRRSSKGNLRWMIAYCHEHLWKGNGLGVYWNIDHYDGPFLDSMEQILEHIGHKYHSRDALGQTCVKVLRKQKSARQKGLESLRCKTLSKNTAKQKRHTATG